MPASPSRRSVARTASASPPADVATPHAVGCGCGIHGVTDRKAVAVDADATARNRKRLRRIEGQVRGLQKMVEDDRYCADIIIQITAARASLQVVAKSLLAAHLKACHAAAIGNGGAVADQMYQELVDLVSKMAR